MPARNTRNVSLPDDLERLIVGLVASGRYASASEVVRAALRMLKRYEEAEAGAPTAPKST